MYVFSDLDMQANLMVSNGLRDSTKQTYSSVQTKYIKFCKDFGLIDVPTCERTILRYIAFLRSQPAKSGFGLALSSIQVHLAGVRSLHIGLGVDLDNLYTARVKLALKSVANTGPPPKQMKPITFQLLKPILHSLPSSYTGMLWNAVITTGFFSCMRAAEYTSTSTQSHFLQLSSLTFHVSAGQRYIQLVIPQTKTKVHGMTKKIGCTKMQICSVCSMSMYIHARNSFHGDNPTSPLFLTESGNIVTKVMLNQKLKGIITSLGLPCSDYSAHSLRSGAATTGSKNGMSQKQLQSLGNWSSLTYLRYLRQDTDAEIQQVNFLTH